MRVVALVDSIDHVCCRYRLSAFATGLAEAGHALEIRPLPRGVGRLWLGSNLSADVVILQRKLLPKWQLALLKWRGRKLIFDCDDAVFSHDSHHPKGIASPQLQRRFIATLQSCDAVVVGNEWLADRCQAASRVRVISTCVDPADYPVANHERRGGLTLVWIGSSSTLKGLERERPLLEAIGQAVPGLTLRLVCDRFIELASMKVEQVAWSPSAEVAALTTADIGISLLPDDDWSRGKCGLKVLQYFASGLPVVGNRVGVTRELVRPPSPHSGEWAEFNGVEPPTGFLADTLDEWVDALRALCDPTLRHELGTNGRRLVDEHYSVAHGVVAWRRLLDELALPARRAG